MKPEAQRFSNVNEEAPERSSCVIATIGDTASGIWGGIYMDIPRDCHMTMSEAEKLHRLLGQAIQYNKHRIDTLVREKLSK